MDGHSGNKRHAVHVHRLSPLSDLDLISFLAPPHLEDSVEITRPSGSASSSRKRPKGKPETGWRKYVALLAGIFLGIPSEEVSRVAGEREVWVCLP